MLQCFTGAAFALEPPNKNENADFGPNEVDTKKIEEVSVSADNPYDTAAPGGMCAQLCQCHGSIIRRCEVNCTS